MQRDTAAADATLPRILSANDIRAWFLAMRFLHDGRGQTGCFLDLGGW